ncbi:leucine-rich repeat-containing G-protein coupled receptor 4 isoform X1 [Procambarus clarkii]|uniref:leucine-rich repeat-containing G-protein coupled receptor 4 isoform X1 n=1 Tax=Procambarus clarkii TaxID=6728 RepID=UPI0037443DE6
MSKKYGLGKTLLGSDGRPAPPGSLPAPPRSLPAPPGSLPVPPESLPVPPGSHFTPSPVRPQKTWCLTKRVWLMRPDSGSCEDTEENAVTPDGGEMSSENQLVLCGCSLGDRHVHQESTTSPLALQPMTDCERPSAFRKICEVAEVMQNNETATRFHKRSRWRHRRQGSWRPAVTLLVVLAAVLRPVLACPSACTCTPLSTSSRVGSPGPREGRRAKGGVRMACVGMGLSAVPTTINNDALDNATITSIDLSINNLTSLPDFAFKDYPSLGYLKVSGNRISSISPRAFHRLPLHSLYLDNNHLNGLLAGSLPEGLLELSLEDNFFNMVPACVAQLKDLQFLNLARNKLTGLRAEDLAGLRGMTSLSLQQNKITEIEPAALQSLSQLQVLDLAENQLMKVPPAILSCPQLTRLLLDNNQITYIEEGAFADLSRLQQVVLQGNPLLTVHRNAFVHLPSLTKLILKETRELAEFPSLNGTHNLETLRIDRASLTSVPDHLCSFTPRLRSLNLHLNSITNIPLLEGCHHLRLLDLSDNAISSLGHGRLRGAPLLHDLLLQHNKITHVPADAFLGLSHLQVLALQKNQITHIEEGAFLPLVSLEDINLGDNVFPQLPHEGLKHVLSIKVHNNPHLRVFPGPEHFPQVRTLALSYAYHCCPFLSLEEEGWTEEEPSMIGEDVLFDVSQFQDIHPGLWNTSTQWKSEEVLAKFRSVWDNLASAFSLAVTTSSSSSNTNITTTAADSATDSATDSAAASSSTTAVTTTSSRSQYTPSPSAPVGDHRPHQVLHVTASSLRLRPQCIPLPGPFMPCRDLFDWWTLRCGVWIVFLLALMGNGVVVVVLVAAYSKMDVPRFLVTNLAVADFFMGVYLGFLAVADASTLGEFRMYAIPWQMSPACQVAGFLGVLSSELSVYTLAVITMERNYAITHAMHLQKRLSLRQAAYIMVVGWMFAITMAVLPLTGVSDYRKFAVCLPFETDGAGLGYVVFLMFINGVAFLILMGCYFKIYCAIRGSQAWNSNDSRIAKRMALLVFTDFICWAPIAFFSLTAAFDMHLISLEEAKVFTVFILPLNSCCNPFLYALLTKQFKKDCVMLCKTIEESRVTRGIGRCRHSSNFSNRQTPANTNSAIDHTSQGDKQSCSCKGKQEKKKKKKKLPRWTFTSLKYFLCTRGAEEITSSSDTSYQTDPAQHRGPRHTSLSSDTYSGSWSDTWRKGRGSSTLRLMDRRRHNSWTASHKPSQESSLSSSRPDSTATSASTSTSGSTATSASTATWRISRSSVSSDTSNSSGKVKSSEPTNPSRLGSLRRGDGRGFGLARQHSQSQFAKETLSTRPSPNGRPKPRLQRQGAVEREAYTPGKENSGLESPPCSLHLRPDHLSCVYEQSHEDDNTMAGNSPSGGLPTQPNLFLSPYSLDTPLDDNVFVDPPDEQAPEPLSRSPSHVQEVSITMPSDKDFAPAATETTALMTDSTSDAKTDNLKEPQPGRVLETHFPLEVPLPEIRPLI